MKPHPGNVGVRGVPMDNEIDRLIALFAEGRYPEAELLARAMTTRDPGHGFGWKALGAIFSSQGRTEESLEPLQKAAELLAIDPEAQVNLGVTLKKLGRLAEAEGCYRRALALDANYPEAYHYLGTVLKDQGRPEEAEGCYRLALQIWPEYAEACNDLGTLLRDRRRLPEAEVLFRRALAAKPQFAEAHSNLGMVFKEQGLLGEAEGCYRLALSLRPDFVQALNNLGIALKEQGRPGEALDCYRRALALKPDFAEALSNQGNVLKVLGELAEAEVCYRRALAARPAYAEAHYNLGHLLLSLGRYAEAWPHYEYRYDPTLAQKAIVLPELPYPQWRGESLVGKSLLVWPEQGFGDCIQFCRYLPLLKGRGVARLTLVCKSALLPLLATLPGVDETTTGPSRSPCRYGSVRPFRPSPPPSPTSPRSRTDGNGGRTDCRRRDSGWGWSGRGHPSTGTTGTVPCRGFRPWPRSGRSPASASSACKRARVKTMPCAHPPPARSSPSGRSLAISPTPPPSWTGSTW